MTNATSHKAFQLGAACAIGELHAEGMLSADTNQVRVFLHSFGIDGARDLAESGMGPAYRDDFKDIFSDAD